MSRPAASRPYALITGGSSGIGLAVARRLRIDGWCVVLVARDMARLQAAREQLESMSGASADCWIECHSLDVTDAAALHALAQDMTQRHGAPMLLLTSAGVARPDYFEALSEADFRQAMDINYFGSLHAVRAVAPHMLAAGRGHVVLVSSAAGLVGIFGYAAYAPTKFAVRGLAEVLRAEFRPRGVQVHVVCPPDTDTPQLAQENLTKPAETRAIAGSGGVLSAAQVAGAIVDGVRRGRFMIAPGLQAGALAMLHSVLAPVLRRAFDRAARTARRA